MRYLLDTGIWLWSVSQVSSLNPTARATLINPEHDLYFSAASVWEIAIKASIARLQLPEPPDILIPREASRLGLRLLPVNHHHALTVYTLPQHHGDPFDRMLVAQALTEGLTLITADREIRIYKVPQLWAGR